MVPPAIIGEGVALALQTNLNAEDVDSTSTNQEFGSSCAAYNDIVLVGTSSSSKRPTPFIYVLAQVGETWTYKSKLPVSVIGGGEDLYSSTVALSNVTGVVGVTGQNNGNGAAYIITTSTWTIDVQLSRSDGVPGDRFGASVAASATTIIIGAPRGGANHGGSAYVYVQRPSSFGWDLQARLAPAVGAIEDNFAFSVAIDADIVTIGAPGIISKRGAAFIYVRSGNAWTLLAELIGADAVSGDQFGYSVAVSSSSVLVGAIGQAAGGGAVYIFSHLGSLGALNSSFYLQAKIRADNPPSEASFGNSVSIRNGAALVGAARESSRGAVYLFSQRGGGAWSNESKLTLPISNLNMNAQFGACVGFSRDGPVVTARRSNFVFKNALLEDVTVVGTGSVYMFAFDSCVGICNTTLGLAPKFVQPLRCLNGSCTPSQCCDQMASCASEICTGRPGFILKIHLPPFCDLCTETECCKRFDCSDFSCGVGFKPRSIIGECATPWCSDTECCEQLDSCQATVCGEGNILKDRRPTYCGNSSCAPSQCCVAASACKANDCGLGFKLKQSGLPIYCQLEACRPAECCESLPSCKLTNCPRGFALKRVLPSFCNNAQCTIAECCDSVSLCTPSACGVNFVIKQEYNLPSYCLGIVCTESECCDLRGLCAMYSCGNGSWIEEDDLFACLGASCTQAECCHTPSDCVRSVCTEAPTPGLALKPASMLPAVCAGRPCSVQDCCDVAGVCTDAMCNGFGLTQKPVPPMFCVETTCSRMECCDTVPIDEKKIDALSLLIGLVVAGICVLLCGCIGCCVLCKYYKLRLAHRAQELEEARSAEARKTEEDALFVRSGFGGRLSAEPPKSFGRCVEPGGEPTRALRANARVVHLSAPAPKASAPERAPLAKGRVIVYPGGEGSSWKASHSR